MSVSIETNFREFENRQQLWDHKVSYWISHVGGILFDSDPAPKNNYAQFKSIYNFPSSMSNFTKKEIQIELDQLMEKIQKQNVWIKEINSNRDIYLHFNSETEGEAIFLEEGNLISREFGSKINKNLNTVFSIFIKINIEHEIQTTFQKEKEKMLGNTGELVTKGWIKIPKSILNEEVESPQIGLFNFVYNTHLMEFNYNRIDYPNMVILI